MSEVEFSVPGIFPEEAELLISEMPPSAARSYFKDLTLGIRYGNLPPRPVRPEYIKWFKETYPGLFQKEDNDA